MNESSQMRTGDTVDRVAAFSARLAAVTGHSQDAAGLAATESARMLTKLNEAAGSTAAELTAAARAQLDAFLDGELRSAPAGQIERRGSGPAG